MLISFYEAGWSLTDELRSVVEKCKNIEQAYELKISEHKTRRRKKKVEEKIRPPPQLQILRRGGSQINVLPWSPPPRSYVCPPQPLDDAMIALVLLTRSQLRVDSIQSTSGFIELRAPDIETRTRQGWSSRRRQRGAPP